MNIGDPLASALVPSAAGVGLATDTFAAQCTAWNPTTYANTVVYAGIATFSNLPVVCADAMSTGPVLIGRAGNGTALVILGPLASP